MIKLIRKTSTADAETQVNNAEDVRGLVYAGLGYDGIIDGYAENAQASISGNNLLLASGEIIFNGWQINLTNEAGESYAVSMPNYDNTKYALIYLIVDTFTVPETASIGFVQGTTPPALPASDGYVDLALTPNGMNIMGLWTITPTGSIVRHADCAVIQRGHGRTAEYYKKSDGTESTRTIEQIDADLTAEKLALTEGTVMVKKATYATYTDPQHATKTIEERLTALGFSQGSITICGATQTNSITRQGNYAIANLSYVVRLTSDIVLTYCQSGMVMAILPEGFKPKNAQTIIIGIIAADPSQRSNLGCGTIEASVGIGGNITVTWNGINGPLIGYDVIINLSIGFECPAR